MDEDVEILDQFDAAEYEKWDMMTRLVNEENVNEGAGTYMGTVLHILSGSRNLEWVQWILRKGANPNLKDIEGKTPLIHAIEFGCEDIVKTLLDTGALPDICDNNEDLPIHYAAMECNFEILKLIIDAYPEGIFSEDNKGRTPLLLLAKVGRYTKVELVECCRLLIKSGSRVNEPDTSDLTPLVYIFSYIYYCEHRIPGVPLGTIELIETAKLLLANGATLDPEYDPRLIETITTPGEDVERLVRSEWYHIPSWAIDFVENQNELRVAAKSILELRKRNSKVIGYNGKDVLGIIAKCVWNFRFDF